MALAETRVGCSLVLACSQAVNAGTLGHWLFDENGGTIAADASGSGWDGTLTDFTDMSMFRARGTAGPYNGRLRLTSRTVGGQAGSSFLNGTVQFVADHSFSTQFAWKISDPNTSSADGQDGGEFDPVYAGDDGFLFVIQDAGPAALGGAGGSMGLDGLGGNYVAVEFDPWPGGVHDADPFTNGNHIAIDLSGIATSIVETPDDPAPGAIPRFNNGGLRYAWVDYDGQTQLMQVFYADTPVKPGNPTLTATVDLTDHFGGNTDLYVGFTAGTGGAFNNHDIVDWSFVSIPEPTSFGLILLGILGLAASVHRRRK